jgi:DNA-binding NarL/FixJ family response regulator
VVSLLAAGRTMKEVAAALGLSPRTVETHKYQIMETLGLKTTADLIRYAMAQGLAGLPTRHSRQISPGLGAGVLLTASVVLRIASSPPPPILPGMDRPRVLLAEDHASIAEQLRKLLEAEFDVVAVVDDGPSLIRAAEELRPDVIVTDIVMPGLDGIAATVALIAVRPDTRVVLVTAFNGPEMAERGYAAGALAHVSKHRAGHELVPAVRAAVRGERYVSPSSSGVRWPAGKYRMRWRVTVCSALTQKGGVKT